MVAIDRRYHLHHATLVTAADPQNLNDTIQHKRYVVESDLTQNAGNIKYGTRSHFPASPSVLTHFPIFCSPFHMATYIDWPVNREASPACRGHLLPAS